ncbi:hypothetical protein H6G97_44020 [Nostoc flagelliforme FACHB-838]|uniref:N-acetylglucosamine-6-phosphate deacetylase n=1 Tax=Nostoc flagelliforme FACHB-838 TaxID=2692904 RepID=A0ABR8E4C6_9NOSO|nr:hypothetical protein [Nostoc flagelliforme]MBD2535931.1 hypothetical protein [Nostoc flagelliforme FACHB-838]
MTTNLNIRNNTLDDNFQIAPLRPIDFHCHGVGSFDFAEVANIVLDRVEKSLVADGVRAILTLYLPEHQFNNFLELIEAYNEGRKEGRYLYIVGIALEGPILASPGGTPKQGVWIPTRHHWQIFSACGEKGLKYVVLSPNADLTKHSSKTDDTYPPNVQWIVETLMDGGVSPALGHFGKKSNAEVCVRAMEKILDIVANRSDKPIVTDHLFNDMPLNFKNAWRTLSAKALRESELEELDLENWNLKNLRERMGIVPATMIEAALAGLLKICINFDGEHVDLAISKKTVELVGSHNLMIMTDRIQSEILAGQRLYKCSGSSLLYQNEGIVAGGSQAIAQQIQNMRMVGIPETDIRNIVSITPAKVLDITPY